MLGCVCGRTSRVCDSRMCWSACLQQESPAKRYCPRECKRIISFPLSRRAETTLSTHSHIVFLFPVSLFPGRYGAVLSPSTCVRKNSTVNENTGEGQKALYATWCVLRVKHGQATPAATLLARRRAASLPHLLMLLYLNGEYLRPFQRA